MRRGTGRGWIALFLLVVAVLAGLVVAPRFVDWSPWREDIARTVGRLSGRAVAIDGDVRLTLLPIPSLIAEDVRLGEAAGGRAPYFARVGRIEADLDLPRLLIGRIVIASLTFISPEIDLVDFPDGPLTGPDLPVERVRFTGGSLGLPLFEEGERLTRLSGEAVFNRDGQGWRLNADFHHRLLPWRLETAGVQAGGGLQLSGQLSARGGATLRLTGSSDAAGSFTGRLRGEGDRASELFMALGLPVPPPARNRFTLDSRVTLTPVTLALEGFTTAIGDQRAQGRLALDWSADSPRADVSLSIPRLDLNGWLAQPQPALSARKSGFRLDGNFALKADTIEWRTGIARAATLIAAASGEVLTITEAHAQLPGGADIAGNGTIDLAAPHAFTGRLEGGADDPRPALDWLGVTLPLPEGRLRRVSAVVDVAGDATSLALSDIDLSFDGSRLTGSAGFAWRDRPQADLRLTLDRGNLDAYLQSPDLTGPDPHVWLKDWEASLELQAKSATLRALPLPQIDLKAHLAAGLIVVESFNGGREGEVAFAVNGEIDRRVWPALVDLRGDLSVPDIRQAGELLDLTIPGVLGRPVSLTTALSLSGPVTEARLALSPQWGEVRGQVIGPVDLVNRTARLDLSLDSPSTAAVLEQVGDLARRTETQDTVASLSGLLTLSPNRWDIRDLKLRLADFAATGQLGWIEGKLLGGLGISALHLDGWSGPLFTSNDLKSWIATLPPAEVALRFGAVDSGLISLRDMAGVLHAAPGSLRLEDVTGRSFDGSVKGRLALATGEAGVSLDGTLGLGNAALAALSGPLFGEPQATASLSLTGSAKAMGGSLLDLWRGLTGEAQLTLGPGNFPGIDEAAAVAAVESATPAERNAALEFALAGGNTAFQKGEGRLVLTQGQVRLEDLDLTLKDGKIVVSGHWPLALGPMVGRVRADLPRLPSFGFEAEGSGRRWTRRLNLPEP